MQSALNETNRNHLKKSYRLWEQRSEKFVVPPLGGASPPKGGTTNFEGSIK